MTHAILAIPSWRAGLAFRLRAPILKARAGRVGDLFVPASVNPEPYGWVAGFEQSRHLRREVLDD